MKHISRRAILKSAGALALELAAPQHIFPAPYGAQAASSRRNEELPHSRIAHLAPGETWWA